VMFKNNVNVKQYLKLLLNQYFVLPSTVTFILLSSLLYRTQLQHKPNYSSIKKSNIMRTLDSEQLTERVSTSKGHIWNEKRRYR